MVPKGRLKKSREAKGFIAKMLRLLLTVGLKSQNREEYRLAWYAGEQRKSILNSRARNLELIYIGLDEAILVMRLAAQRLVLRLRPSFASFS